VPKRKKLSRAPTTKPGITVLPISCASCGAWSWVTLPGAAPWPGAIFNDRGWTVLNEPEEGHVVFACPTCFEKEMNSPSSKIKGEG
jgi:hypothetical protein